MAIRKIATVEVHENKNVVKTFGFTAGDKGSAILDVRFKYLFGVETLVGHKLRWTCVDEKKSVVTGETTVLNGEQAEIVLPDGLFDSERNMQVQLTLADNSTGVILGIQDLISIRVAKNIAHNGIVGPVYDVLINDLYEDTKKYLKQLEDYSVTTPNGGNAEFLRGFAPSKFGTKEEVDFNLLATLGIPYGGILNNSITKTSGTAYYDQTGKKIYKCIANTSLNYADAGYFEAISNNDLNEKFKLEIIYSGNSYLGEDYTPSFIPDGNIVATLTKPTTSFKKLIFEFVTFGTDGCVSHGVSYKCDGVIGVTAVSYPRKAGVIVFKIESNVVYIERCERAEVHLIKIYGINSY